MRQFGRPALGYSLWESGDWKYLVPFYGLKDLPEAVEALEEPEYLIPGYGLKDLPEAVEEAVNVLVNNNANDITLFEPLPNANANTFNTNVNVTENRFNPRSPQKGAAALAGMVVGIALSAVIFR